MVVSYRCPGLIKNKTHYLPIKVYLQILFSIREPRFYREFLSRKDIIGIKTCYFAKQANLEQKTNVTTKQWTQNVIFLTHNRLSFDRHLSEMCQCHVIVVSNVTFDPGFIPNIQMSKMRDSVKWHFSPSRRFYSSYVKVSLQVGIVVNHVKIIM